MATLLKKFDSKYCKVKSKRPLKVYLQQLQTKKKPTRMLVFKMVPLVGFELTTYRLQGECSTN